MWVRLTKNYIRRMPIRLYMLSSIAYYEHHIQCEHKSDHRKHKRGQRLIYINSFDDELLLLQDKDSTLDAG